MKNMKELRQMTVFALNLEARAKAKIEFTPPELLELLDDLDELDRYKLALKVERERRKTTKAVLEIAIVDREKLRVESALLLEVLKAARLHDLSQTVSFDLTRGPGSQRVYEIDQVFVKALQRALAGCSDIKIEG